MIWLNFAIYVFVPACHPAPYVNCIEAEPHVVEQYAHISVESWKECREAARAMATAKLFKDPKCTKGSMP